MSGSITSTRKRYADEINRAAGWAIRRSAPSQKVLSMALHLSEGRVSHVCAGDPTGAPQRFFQLVSDLTLRMRDLKTHPGRLLADAITEAEESLRPFTHQDVRALFFHALQMETQAQAREDVSEQAVTRFLGEWQEGRGSPALLTKLHEALLEHEEATAEEMGWMMTKRLLGREVRRRVEQES